MDGAGASDSSRTQSLSPTRPNQTNQMYTSDIVHNGTNPEEVEQAHHSLREAMNQDLIDLLRSQIARLLEENENILVSLDEYRQKFATSERERKETLTDPSNEILALQTELSDARLREAELTVAFEELQHRITAIDRIIEMDPEMETFFNTVTIMPTKLSAKPTIQSSHSRHTSSINQTQKNISKVEIYDNRMGQSKTHRRPDYVANNSNLTKITSPTFQKRNSYYYHLSQRAIKTHSMIEANDMDSDLIHTRIQRSGLNSPLSDSGCSLTSHTTSDGREITNDRIESTHKNSIQSPYSHLGLYKTRNMFNQDTNRDEDENDDEDDEDQPEDDEKAVELNQTSIIKSKNLIPLLRRSRSSAADHVLNNSLTMDLISSSPSKSQMNRTYQFEKNPDVATTPTDAIDPTERAPQERKVVDRLSRIRASLRQSLGIGFISKPDFRMEAFAARQGEARALLKLRETRLDLLRVQSRCQTLQRHIERLEAVNSCRMTELEDAVASDRELRQQIRNYQRRIFQLEAEHREYIVNQRIKEMELLSKLAESNLRLSNAEMNTQQAAVWSQLNKAHEAAALLLSPAQSQNSLISNSMLALDSPSTRENVMQVAEMKSDTAHNGSCPTRELSKTSITNRL